MGITTSRLEASRLGADVDQKSDRPSCWPYTGSARVTPVDCNDITAEALEYLAPHIVEAKAYVSLQPLGQVADERTQLVQLIRT